MRALQINQLGRPLEPVELADPEPGRGEILVRILAAGICRSDVHYRSGHRAVPRLPLTPGHEIAGIVELVGPGVDTSLVGQRVCLHYLVTCGACGPCRRGAEQFCEVGQMVGLDRQGGYAESIVVPARNAHRVPDGVSMEAAAVMMCSTATSLHALRRGGVTPGDRVAVFGCGGLGMSAIQLALVLGAREVYAVDLNHSKLAAAEGLGAIPVIADDDVAERLQATGGVDVALELVGIAEVMRVAVASLAVGGRAVAVGITHEEFGLDPFRDLVLAERSIIGSADHLSSEIDELLGMADRGDIQLDRLVTKRIALSAASVNAAMDSLEDFGDDIRTVIVAD